MHVTVSLAVHSPLPLKRTHLAPCYTYNRTAWYLCFPRCVWCPSAHWEQYRHWCVRRYYTSHYWQYIGHSCSTQGSERLVQTVAHWPSPGGLVVSLPTNLFLDCSPSIAHVCIYSTHVCLINVCLFCCRDSQVNISSCVRSKRSNSIFPCLIYTVFFWMFTGTERAISE